MQIKYKSNNTQFCCTHSEYIQLACDFVNKNFDKFILHAKMSGNNINFIVMHTFIIMIIFTVDWSCTNHHLVVDEWRASW